MLSHVSRLAKRYLQVQDKVGYLQKCYEQMEYPTYQRNGWPIGSGSVLRLRQQRRRSRQQQQARHRVAQPFQPPIPPAPPS